MNRKSEIIFLNNLILNILQKGVSDFVIDDFNYFKQFYFTKCWRFQIGRIRSFLICYKQIKVLLSSLS